MNLQHLKYMTEVERVGSVTKAAANLFMGQPNLSKAIKEVENEIGITVFRRSAKGVYPTPEGTKFLSRARAVLAEMEKLEALFCGEESGERFAVCVSEAEYVPEVMAELCRFVPENSKVEIECVTASLFCAAEQVSEGKCSIAAVLCPADSEDSFHAFLNEKKLRAEALISGENKLLISERSPVSKAEKAALEMLAPLIGISSADTKNATSFSGRRIILTNGSDPYELLSRLPEAYMLTAPVSEKTMKKYELVQLDLADGGKFTEYLIYPSGYKPDGYAAAFAECLKSVIIERYK